MKGAEILADEAHDLDKIPDGFKMSMAEIDPLPMDSKIPITTLSDSSSSHNNSYSSPDKQSSSSFLKPRDLLTSEQETQTELTIKPKDSATY